MSFWMAGATIGGAALGYMGTKSSNAASKDAYEADIANQQRLYAQYLEANKDAGKPVWADEQMPYLFTGDTWIPDQLTASPEALEYGQTIAAGGIPGVPRQAGPLSLAEINNQLGFGGGQSGFGGEPGQDIANLLGFGATAPPPLYPDLMNNTNPSNSQQPPPPPVAAPPPVAEQQPQQPQMPQWSGAGRMFGDRTSANQAVGLANYDAASQGYGWAPPARRSGGGDPQLRANEDLNQLLFSMGMSPRSR